MNRRAPIALAASLLAATLVPGALAAPAGSLAPAPPGWNGAAVARIEFIPMRPIPFEHDVDVPAAHAEQDLRDAARLIRDDPRIRRVLIKGFTDATAGIDYNDALSRRRAEAVRGRLVEHGAPAGLLHLSAHGKTSPIDEDWTHAGRARNRRVEIYLVREP